MYIDFLIFRQWLINDIFCVEAEQCESNQDLFVFVSGRIVSDSNVAVLLIHSTERDSIKQKKRICITSKVMKNGFIEFFVLTCVKFLFFTKI